MLQHAAAINSRSRFRSVAGYVAKVATKVYQRRANRVLLDRHRENIAQPELIGQRLSRQKEITSLFLFPFGLQMFQSKNQIRERGKMGQASTMWQRNRVC